jgi:hypothetical protein
MVHSELFGTLVRISLEEWCILVQHFALFQCNSGKIIYYSG